jgi:predicted translin family RNA/ssDNA-binding protein
MLGRPYPYRQATTAPFDLTALGEQVSLTEEKRQEAFTKARKLQIGLSQAKNAMETDSTSTTDMDTTTTTTFHDTMAAQVTTLLSEIEMPSTTTDSSTTTRTPRQANLSSRVEEYARFHAFSYFLSTGGMLLPPSLTAAYGATDEEYLAGAVMGLCQELGRYGMGRATARDINSVEKARNLVSELLDYLLQFDFRNGLLRRKYDGTKYALKNLETLLYELSVTGGGEGQPPDTKRTKLEASTSSCLHAVADELEAIRARVVHRDDLRETLIKKCRDGQKAAKQAIYALHRQDVVRAEKLLQECEACIRNELLPIVQEEPPLRYGSFANVLEEYAEAKMFHVWLVGRDGSSNSESNGIGDYSTPSGVLLLPQDFVDIALEPEEYLGGLCDLTGEIGRFAVQRGTVRDAEGVKQCLDACGSIHLAIQTMERIPHQVGKKMDQLRRSVEKLERMLYEMSLSEAAGRSVQTNEEEAENNVPTGSKDE